MAIIKDMWKFLHINLFPETNFEARLALKADLAWQPYLHPAVLIGCLLTLAFGDRDMIPPVDHWDWLWLAAGIVSPLLGFASIWMMKTKTGRARYRAFWLRLAANLGIITAMTVYEIARFSTEIRHPIEYHPIVDTVFISAIAFMTVVVVRDIRFLIVVEKVAALIYRDLRHLNITETLEEWAADDNR